MSKDITKEQKQKAIDILRRRTDEQRDQLKAIEPRLLEYYDHLCQYSGTTLGDADDLHNGNELLCAVRLLRLLRTYELNADKIDEVIYDGEGSWKLDVHGYWEHIEGGLGQPGRKGNEVYRWEPFQIFMIVAMYGLRAWIGTGNYEGDRRPIETERINEQTREIEDLRRLCIRFVLFGPRKINKSGFAAITNVEDFMRGDYDAQVVCTANSQEQSKILFNKTKDLLLQLDPVSGRKFNGKFLTFTNTSVRFMKGKGRAAELIAIPAGGKMPDGKFASRSAEDEYGSAEYTNGRSDMGQTAAVIESSMGPRREPMTVITTTASLIKSGPFIEMLDSIHALLLREIDYDEGTDTPTLAEDRQMFLLLEPDPWERDDEYLLTSRTLRRKINPMLGKIVQHSFYDTEVTSSRMDETKKKETISKLFNLYQSATVTEWIKGDRIRPLQIARRVTDCKYSEGWNTFVGLDFSHGDDLFAITYLSVDYKPSNTMAGRFFADCEAWVLEDALLRSPNRPLFEMWIEQGWLHVCPGEAFNPDYAINELMSKHAQGVNMMMFGYDPAQSKQPINTLKAWLQTLGIDARMIEAMVVPISQTALNFNPAICDVEDWIKAQPEAWIQFSMSPLWPWCFGNARIEMSLRNDLRRVVKSAPSEKVDPVHGLIDATVCFNLSESKLKQ